MRDVRSQEAVFSSYGRSLIRFKARQLTRKPGFGGLDQEDLEQEHLENHQALHLMLEEQVIVHQYYHHKEILVEQVQQTLEEAEVVGEQELLEELQLEEQVVQIQFLDQQ